jgi:iron(III) transport system permease protein
MSHKKPARNTMLSRPRVPTRNRANYFWVLLVAVVSVLVLAPLVPLVWMAWGNGADGMRRLLELPGVLRVLRDTAVLGVGALAVGMVMGTVLALCVYSMHPRARKWLEFTPLIPMMLPAVAHVIGFVFLFSPEAGFANTALRATPFFDGSTGPVNVYTPTWIVIYTGTYLSSFAYMFVYTGLKNLGSEYALAARVNGAGSLRVLFTVTLPMLRPVLIYASIVVLLLALGQFTAPLILGRRENVDVMTTEIFRLSGEYPVDFPLAAALGTPLIAVALALVAVQRNLIGDPRRFVGKGNSTIDNRRFSPAITWLAASITTGYITLTAVLPLGALIFVAVSPYWSGTVDVSKLTFDHFSSVLSSGSLVRSIVTTLVVSIAGILLCIPLGMLVSIGIFNRDKLWRPISTLLDILANLPLAVPAALVGFGFLFAFSDPRIGLYGTQASLIIAFVAIMLPYSVRYQLTTLQSLGRETFEASQVAGANPLRTFLHVTLPLSRNGITSAAAIMFVLLTHEFAVALLLRTPGTSVMSVVLFDQYNGGSYGQGAVIALLMTLLTACGVVIALLVGGRQALARL